MFAAKAGGIFLNYLQVLQADRLRRCQNGSTPAAEIATSATRNLSPAA